MKDAKHILNQILNERKVYNPAYSLRAFARDLKISPQQLSNVMNGRRGLSPEMAQKISITLKLEGTQKEIFVESLKAKFSKKKTEKFEARSKLKTIQSEATTKSLEMDAFKAISNWYHFTLVELIKITSNENHKISFFAKRLGISTEEIKNTLDRLERLGLISKDHNGYKVNQNVIIADKGITNESIRNFHRQIMEKAMYALAFQGPEERYGSSSTLPIKVKDLDKAKKLIQNFRLQLDDLLSDEVNADEVYGLSIQFFKLTNSQE